MNLRAIVQNLNLAVPEKLVPLWTTKDRYIVLYGGRGGAKSWNVARFLVVQALSRDIVILCCREIQDSIDDSVKALLEEQINALGLEEFFDIKKTEIVCKLSGARFIFKGLYRNVHKLKSIGKIDYCWIEEAETISKETFEKLDPSIRTAGSQIIITFNPESEDSAIYQKFIKNKLDNARVIKINYTDNPWFPEVLEVMRQQCKERDYELYRHIWLGEVKQIGDDVIFKGRWEVAAFDLPNPYEVQYYSGLDHGYATDPMALVQCFVIDDILYVSHAVAALNVELDEMPQVFDKVPIPDGVITYGDNSRPETNSYLRSRGFRVVSCDKWSGCVDDGVARLKAFKKIVIHPRCKYKPEQELGIVHELSNYKYKRDKNGIILPIIIDKHNHCIDALRYALQDIIRRKMSIYDYD